MPSWLVREWNNPRRRWPERVHVIVKAVLAGVLAWLAGHHLLGHPQPYYAPLAALLGVYPTVERSLRESLSYAGSFVLAVALAVPVGMLLGPGPVGLALVLTLSLALSSWWRLGEQGTQIPFISLFTLLMGGHDGLSYAGPRLGDVAVGLAVGLAVNLLVFPPLHLRRAEYALAEARDEMVGALCHLAGAVIDPDEWEGWERRERRLVRSVDRARRTCDRASDSLRGNPRAALRARRDGTHPSWQGDWRAPRQMAVLERGLAYVRSMAGTVRRAEPFEGPFARAYARQLRLLAAQVRRLPHGGDARATEIACRAQDRLERPHSDAGTDAPGIFDPQKELIRLSRVMLDDVGVSDGSGPREIALTLTRRQRF
ncbi:FUSC family protein [Actinomadura kijaniata]|uniref:FUSC family protein n=1 Tax=Actinomadura kijaniata TaxID=46161 RepID=UPI00083792C3|nr:aromatic acid exporter family protein [Actinomadura kijaniata]